jgi:hypothetical protein
MERVIREAIEMEPFSSLCLYLCNFSHTSHFTLKMEAVWTFEMLVSYNNTIQYHSLENLDLKCCL